MKKGEIKFSKYPNGGDCIKAKNMIGVVRFFELSCCRLALRFSRGSSTEDKY